MVLNVLCVCDSWIVSRQNVGDSFLGRWKVTVRLLISSSQLRYRFHHRIESQLGSRSRLKILRHRLLVACLCNRVSWLFSFQVNFLLTITRPYRCPAQHKATRKASIEFYLLGLHPDSDTGSPFAEIVTAFVLTNDCDSVTEVKFSSLVFNYSCGLG